MKIVKVNDVEDCFDGSYIKEFVFDQPVNRPFIEFLETLGKLQYFPSFAKPFYKLSIPSTGQMKGIEGNRSAQVLIYDNQALGDMEQLRTNLEGFEEGGCRDNE